MSLPGATRGRARGRRGPARRDDDDLAERLRSAIRTAPTEHADTAADAEVRDAVERLPPRLAELVRLVHRDGFSIAEAATISGTSASTARSRYAAARTALRAALGGEAEDRQGASPPRTLRRAPS